MRPKIDGVEVEGPLLPEFAFDVKTSRFAKEMVRRIITAFQAHESADELRSDLMIESFTTRYLELRKLENAARKLKSLRFYPMNEGVSLESLRQYVTDYQDSFLVLRIECVGTPGRTKASVVAWLERARKEAQRYLDTYREEVAPYM